MTIESTRTIATVPARGDRLPSFTGTTPTGDPIRLRDFYLRRNLALIFTHGAECGACRDYLTELNERRAAIHAEAAEILAVIPDDSDAAPFPFPIALDAGNQIHRRYGLVDADGRPRAAIFLVDRYGIVFEVSVASDEHTMLAAEEVPGWLEFIACRCS
ncbi:MAG: redoxin domain-containing protein [Nitrolancea sp.]